MQGSFFTFQSAVDLMAADKIDFANLDIRSFSLTNILDVFENQIQRKSMKTVIDLNLWNSMM